MLTELIDCKVILDNNQPRGIATFNGGTVRLHPADAEALEHTEPEPPTPTTLATQLRTAAQRRQTKAKAEADHRRRTHRITTHIDDNTLNNLEQLRRARRRGKGRD